MSHAFVKDIVTISSSNTESHFDLSVLELGYSNSPHLARNVMRKASSDSSTESDWFDVGLSPENVPEKDWPDASDEIANAFAAVVAGPSSQRRGSRS